MRVERPTFISARAGNAGLGPHIIRQSITQLDGTA